MAVRGNTNYYLIKKIQRRHWITQAQQVGLGAKVGELLIEDVIGRTASVIDEVSGFLPDGFPMDLADTIFSGMRWQSARLATAG